MLKNGKSLDFKRLSGIEKVHRNSFRITVDFLYPNMIKMNRRPSNLCGRSKEVPARKEENARMEGDDMGASFVTQQIDYIESEVYKRIKPLGFRKHGRTLHRFVSGDISQVISFQCGQAYLDATHLMWVNIGIRIPECTERRFDAVNSRKYYHEYHCTMRSRLGIIASRDLEAVKTFCLYDDIETICGEIISEIENDVLPVFDILSSRQAILEHRREYPWFDKLNHHLIKLEECMIYGHLGDLAKARELFDEYYESALQRRSRCPGHIPYLDELRSTLGFS